VTAQRDIDEQFIVSDIESESLLRKNGVLSADDEIVRNTSSHKMTNGQWILKLRKRVGSAGLYVSQSPNQIGAAVTSAARHHMNLAMYHLQPEDYGYTDTDSLLLRGSVVESSFLTCPGLINESAEAPMGTYKNDHETKGERIFLSFLLGKKVKLHVTLNSEGRIIFHSTFKGYTPAAIDENGMPVSQAALEYQKAWALGRVYFFGGVEGLTQTEFRRDIVQGITIDKDSKFSASVESLCKVAKGTVFEGSIERVIPLGNEENVQFCFQQTNLREVMENRARFLENNDGFTWERFLEFISVLLREDQGGAHHLSSTPSNTDPFFDQLPRLREEDRLWPTF
jgi:hypothetical protein